MIKDPCKSAKCISYPICLNKETIKCDILLNHISEYLIKSQPDYNINEPYKMTVDQARYIHEHIIKIFPNLKNLPYAVKLIMGYLDLEDRTFVTTEKDGNTYKLVTYDYSNYNGYPIVKKAQYQYGKPPEIYMK